MIWKIKLKKKNYFFIPDRYWRGSEQVSPKCATLACELIWAEGNQDPVGSREKISPSLYLEESKLGVFPRIRVISRDKLYLSDSSVGQGKNLILKHLLLFLLPCDVTFFFFSLQSSRNLFHSLVQNGAYTSFYLSALELLMYVRLPYTQN